MTSWDDQYRSDVNNGYVSLDTEEKGQRAEMAMTEGTFPSMQQQLEDDSFHWEREEQKYASGEYGPGYMNDPDAIDYYTLD